MELMELPALKDLKVQQEQLGHKALKVSKVQQELMVQKEILVHKVFRGQPEPTVQMVLME